MMLFAFFAVILYLFGTAASLPQAPASTLSVSTDTTTTTTTSDPSVSTVGTIYTVDVGEQPGGQAGFSFNPSSYVSVPLSMII
jgi:hypothetical protein